MDRRYLSPIMSYFAYRPGKPPSQQPLLDEKGVGLHESASKPTLETEVITPTCRCPGGGCLLIGCFVGRGVSWGVYVGKAGQMRASVWKEWGVWLQDAVCPKISVSLQVFGLRVGHLSSDWGPFKERRYIHKLIYNDVYLLLIPC